MKSQLTILCLTLGLACLAHADASPTAAAALSPAAAAALSPAAAVATAASPTANASWTTVTAGTVGLSAGAEDKLYVMQEVRVVAKRGDAERKALAAAAKQALDEAKLRHWVSKPVTESDLLRAITREEDLGAFDLGAARVESVTQQRLDDPSGKEAWSCRLVLSLHRK